MSGTGKDLHDPSTYSSATVILGRELIEAGCQWLRADAQSDFEHVWMLASIALIQSDQNRVGHTAKELLWLPSGPPRYAERMRDMDTQHRRHVLLRFPDETRVALAEVLARPEARAMPNRPSTPAFFMSTAIGDDDHHYEGMAADRVRETITRLSALVDLPAIGAEARLRRAIVRFHRAKGTDLTDSVLDAQRAAAQATDSHVEYLSHLYAGFVLDALNRRLDAIKEFRAATAVIPGAHSAALALATQLFLVGQRDEAAAVVERVFEEPEREDPWRTFSLGDWRFWPGYLGTLRLDLKS